MANQGIPVIGGVLARMFGTRNERFVKRYTQRVDAINALETKTRQMTDQQIASMHAEFRKRHDDGATEEDLLIEVFAVAREGMDRAVGIRSIFNPLHAETFDPSRLDATVRELYEKTKSEMAALEPREPEDDLLGNAEPIPSWVWHPVPNEVYEGVRELYPESRPPFRSRPFDVQLIGAMVLAGGKIAEMKTGEGKTIVAPLACYLASVQRQQVHVVTVNDYLVQRDRDWVFPFFHALGMTVGAIHPMHIQDEEVKRKMYRCDIVYGTTSEFGFDYLRDNMKRSVEQQVQRQRQFAVVDEVDSILIDEARTPLIISGAAHDEKPRYEMADKIARHLVDKHQAWQACEDAVKACKERIKGLEGDVRQTRDKAAIPEIQKRLEEDKKQLPELEAQRDQYTQYYEANMDRKSAHLTHEGISEAQRVAGLGSFYIEQNMDLPHLVEQSVRAHAVYTRDKDYVIMNVPDRMTNKSDQTIVIVDSFTGRPMIGRQWSDGLHQAVESKEGVPIKDETQTVATVTIQNFFKMYKRLAGMTGTADTEAQEFHDIYKLDVVSIPTNKTMIRSDHPDRVYLRVKDKWEHIVDEIKTFHDVGRPILIGTTSVDTSEMLSKMLTKKYGAQHSVLNAKQHDKESGIIQDAGVLGAVMIATNMAGRGTDIKLGVFTHEELLQHWLKRGICSRKLKPDASEIEIRRDVFRKIAPTELAINKREAEGMDPDELELDLLRHWTRQLTLLSEKAIDDAPPDELRDALDDTGRILIHRIRWFDNCEDLGGLHVIGTERHESRRIDNQLRGRSGRQGDKGSSRFYVSLEDDLMQMFGGETMMKILPKLGLKEGDAIESAMLTKRIEGAQRKVEERNFQWRKNILEYDEIMEVQRQGFYGLRQRVLEGRNVKGLIIDFVQDSVEDAAEKFLDPFYGAECAAEFAKERLDVSILPEKLRGRDPEDMDIAIRREAREEARHMIDVTMGEYIPMEGSEISVDFDSAGLSNWAASTFGVDIDAGELRSGGIQERRQVFDTLCTAAFEKIDSAALEGLDEFAHADFGPRKLSEWAKARFGIDAGADEIMKAEDDDDTSPVALITDRAAEVYKQREINYPVEFSMDMTMALMRQGQLDATDQLAAWARRRFDLDLDGQKLKAMAPAKVRQTMLDASRNFVETGQLQKEIDDALAKETDDALDEHLNTRFAIGITERMRWLEGRERENAVRARVESILRAELLDLERTVFLGTLDQVWKDHLYEMDQLRSGISFRAFSQRDPRIEFKREGSRLFAMMMANIKDQVTEQILRARFNPAAMMGTGPQRKAPPAPPIAQRPASGALPAALAGTPMGASIVGPGFEPPATPPPPPPTSQPGDAPSPKGDSDNGEPETPSADEQQEAARIAHQADRKSKRKR